MCASEQVLSQAQAQLPHMTVGYHEMEDAALVALFAGENRLYRISGRARITSRFV